MALKRTTFLLLYVALALSLVNGKSVVWEKPSGTEILDITQLPSGVEAGLPLYVCRVCNPNCTPGKIWMGRNNSVECHLPIPNGDFVSIDFEVLNEPIGVTSWVSVSPSSITGNAIVVGSTDKDEPTYLCRGLADRNGLQLVPGRYLESTRTCSVRIGGRVVDAYDVEILVINRYGLYLGYTPN